MCILWVAMLLIHFMPPGPQLDAWLALALPSPKGMFLCVIMSPSSGYFPVSPLSLKQPSWCQCLSSNEIQQAEPQGGVGMEGQC